MIRVLVKHNLQKNKHKLDKTSMTAFEAFKLVLSICGIMFLFGLTWIFAIFTFVSTNRDAAFSLQFIFALFNALQGFWIFFFFVFLNAEARQSWIKLLFACKNKNKDAPPTSKTGLSSKKNKYYTASKSNTYSSTPSTASDSGGLGTLEHNMYSKKSKAPGIFLHDDVTSSVIIEEKEEEGSSPDIEEQEPVKKTYQELMEEGEEEKKKHTKLEKRTSREILAGARLKRKSTKRRGHDVEQIELDFFDDDDNVLVD